MSQDLLIKIAQDIAEIKASLTEHMRRTEASERRLDLLEDAKPVTLKGLVTVFAAAGIIAGAVKGIYEFLRIWHIF